MFAGALLIDFGFQAAGWIPERANANIVEVAVTLNYTTILNVVFLTLAAALLIRFFRTGRPGMLRMMIGSQHRHLSHRALPRLSCKRLSASAVQ
jgi:hypothetical protein